MNVNAWGPPLWSFLHTMVLNASQKTSKSEQKYYELYFMALGETLPCKYCRESYKIFSQKLPVKQFSRTRLGLFYWVYRLHDLVNKKLGKGPSPSFFHVLRKYEGARVESKQIDVAEVASAEKHYQKRADRLLRGFDPATLNRSKSK